MSKEKRILIVEDNELNLKLFKDLLEAKGYTVHVSVDGKNIVAQTKEVQPGLILMDIQLHGISGYDLIKEIKQQEDIKDIPIIAVTAFAMKSDKDRIMESGCEDYISKPISIDPFLEKIGKYI